MYAAVHTTGPPGPGRLFECASDFSPWVEEIAPDTVIIPVGGLRRLFRTVEELGNAIARRVGELGIEASVALADNPDLAIHGALGYAGVTIMDEAKTAGLPLDVLAAPPAIAGTLALWGLRTFRDFAALPEDGVAERLGEEGVRLQKLARGHGARPLVPSNPPPPFEASLELEYPLTLLEPLSFIVSRLLNDLCEHLASRGLAAHELRLTLTLEGAAPHERMLHLPYPMRDARTFLKLLALDIDQHPPAAPVIHVSLAAEPVNPRVVQHGLFIPLAPEPQKLELTLARLNKLVGDGNVGAPELVDTHRPRAFRMKHFIPEPGSRRDVARSPHLALRAFRPALPAHVQAPNGRPVHVAARGVRGRVLDFAGPWRTSGDWWRDDAWSRDEWDVTLSDGALYLVYRDRRDGNWFVEGAYD